MQPVRLVWFIIVLMVVFPGLVHAQSNSICVLAFEDANKNGQRDVSELPLPNITITLAVPEDIIIQSYITTQDERPYCFEGLSDGMYTITFEDSPAHTKTTENRAEVPLASGNRMRVEFGAVALSPFDSPTEVEASATSDELESANRLLLAVVGGLLAMLLMAGLGVLMAGFLY